MINIETPRYQLRQIDSRDMEGMFELDSDPEVHKYLGLEPVQTREQVSDIINYIQAQYETDGFGRLAIIDKEDGSFVGWTGIKYEHQVREFSYYDLGYRLKQTYWGKGIATETAIASLKFGFEELKLPEICAAAHIENIASQKVCLKAGLKFKGLFEFEGITHKWFCIKRSEWRT